MILTDGSTDPFASHGLECEVTVVVCSSCRQPGDANPQPRPGARLATETAEAARGSAVRVCEAACLGNCNRGLSAAFLKHGSWSYVFGQLSEGDGADLVAGAELFAASKDSVLPFRGRPAALKGGLIARIPPFHEMKEPTR